LVERDYIYKGGIYNSFGWAIKKLYTYIYTKVLLSLIEKFTPIYIYRILSAHREANSSYI